MQNVLTYQYALESMREARERDNNYQHVKKIVKFDPRRNQRNRTFEKRLEFNKRKLQIHE